MQAVETLRLAQNTRMDQEDRAGSVLMGDVESNNHPSFLNLRQTPPIQYHYTRRADSQLPGQVSVYDGGLLTAAGRSTR